MKHYQKNVGVLLSAIFLSLLCLMFVTTVRADTTGPEEKPFHWAIGYEAAFPLCYGLTFTYNLTQSLAVQSLITMSPQPIMLSTVKVSYKLKQGQSSDTYLYALAGQFEDDAFWDFKSRVTGYGMGIGTEFTPKFYPDNYKNYFEIGAVDFNSSEYHPSLTVSAGIKVYY